MVLLPVKGQLCRGARGFPPSLEKNKVPECPSGEIKCLFPHLSSSWVLFSYFITLGDYKLLYFIKWLRSLDSSEYEPDVFSLWYWVNNLSPEPVWRWSWDANASILLWELDDVCGGHALSVSAPVPFLVISSPQAHGASGEGQGCPYEKGLILLACDRLVSHLFSFRKSHLPACPWAPPQTLLRGRNETPNYLNARK